jgi:hypothetical protein
VIKHAELNIRILAPDGEGKCIYGVCKEHNGDWHIIATDDRDHYIFDIPSVCERHLIFAMIDAVTEPYA